MSDEYTTHARCYVGGSLAAVEQRRLSSVTVCYFTSDKEIEVSIRSWKRINYEKKEDEQN